MSIVCAKNFAKIIERPHRPRVLTRFKTQNFRTSTIASAARRTPSARVHKRHPRLKALFVSLAIPAESRRKTANCNTISILAPSPRTIIPRYSAAFRAE